MSWARTAHVVLWPLILVFALVLFTAIDADGDPTTSNGPPVILATPTDELEASEQESRGVGGDVGETEAPRRRLWEGRWFAAVRTEWFSRLLPIRGP